MKGDNEENPKSPIIFHLSRYRTFFVQPVFLELFYHSDMVYLEFEGIFGSQ
jgi:hypothetical protein